VLEIDSPFIDDIVVKWILLTYCCWLRY